MTRDEIIDLQNTVGTVPDGWWGPKSIAACQSHLKKLAPYPSPWPGTSQQELQAFFGRPGDEDNLVQLSVEDLDVRFEGSKVHSIACHRKVGQSLRRILLEVADVWPWVLTHYAGCYNNRNVRGGKVPSLHAYGAAIDLWPEKNGNHTHWPVAAEMPVGIMECFAAEGWTAAGAFWSRDACHFQATRM